MKILLLFPMAYAICLLIHLAVKYFKGPKYEHQTHTNCITCGKLTAFKKIYFPTGQCTDCVAKNPEQINN